MYYVDDQGLLSPACSRILPMCDTSINSSVYSVYRVVSTTHTHCICTYVYTKQKDELTDPIQSSTSPKFLQSQGKVGKPRSPAGEETGMVRELKKHGSFSGAFKK